MTMQVSHAQGQLLGRVTPGVTTPVQLYKAGELRTEITLILVAQAPLAGAATSSLVIFHDDSGSDVYDITTVVMADSFDKNTAPSTPWFQSQHPGSGLMIAPNGSIAVQTSTIDETVFTCYGITETLAERMRGR